MGFANCNLSKHKEVQAKKVQIYSHHNIYLILNSKNPISMNEHSWKSGIPRMIIKNKSP